MHITPRKNILNQKKKKKKKQISPTQISNKKSFNDARQGVYKTKAFWESETGSAEDAVPRRPTARTLPRREPHRRQSRGHLRPFAAEPHG